MAKDKERTLNPAAAHLKAQKKTALKKGKAQLAVQRNEKLARRNPERLQRQIDDLKATQAAQGGSLRPRDKQLLEQLERDVKAIRKAREADPSYSRPDQKSARRPNDDQRQRQGTQSHRQASQHHHQQHVLGKRRRPDSEDYKHDGHESEEETDEDVRAIPMPRDTPPPIPPRQRKHQSSNPNSTGLGERAGPATKPAAAAVAAQAQTTYTAAPQIRDLRKEATSKFMPAAVAARLKERAGVGGSSASSSTDGGRQGQMDRQQVGALGRDGYADASMAADEAANEMAHTIMAESVLEEEEAALERELMQTEPEVENGVGGVDARLQAAGVQAHSPEESTHTQVAHPSSGAGALPSKHLPSAGENSLLRYQSVEDLEDDSWG